MEFAADGSHTDETSQYLHTLIASQQRPHSAGNVSIPLFGYGAGGSSSAASPVAGSPTHHRAHSPLNKQSRNRLELVALQQSLAALMDPFQTYFKQQRQRCVKTEESDRATMSLEMLLEEERFYRTLIREQENSIGWRGIESQRREEAWAPWCTHLCRYCCDTRLARERDVRKANQRLREMLTEQETIVRDALSDALFAEINTLWTKQMHRGQIVVLLQTQIETLEAEHRHYGLIVDQLQRNAFDVILKEKNELLDQWQKQQQLTAAREQRLLNEQERERLTAVQRKQERQMEYFLSEREREARHLLCLQEVAFRKEMAARMVDEAAQITSATWRRDMQHVFQELDELRAFKHQTETQAAETEAKRIVERQASLEKEFADCKKMKKAGPPKVPILPPCSRCGLVPAKDDFTHRLTDCTERPVQCAKCTLILPLSQQEAHKPVCPSRVLPCPTCQNHYKASYLETVHMIKCMTIQSYQKELPLIRATFPWTLADSKYRMSMMTGPDDSSNGEIDAMESTAIMVAWEDRVEGTPVILRPGTNKKVPDGVVVGLLEVNGKSTRTLAELFNVFPEERLLTIGEKFSVTLSLPGSLMQQRGGPAAGGRSPALSAGGGNRSPSLAALGATPPSSSVAFSLEPSLSNTGPFGSTTNSSLAATGGNGGNSTPQLRALPIRGSLTGGSSRSPAVTPRRSLGVNAAVTNDAIVELQAVPDGVTEEVYQSMVLLTNSDVAQYCKPQPEKKRAGSAKK